MNTQVSIIGPMAQNRRTDFVSLLQINPSNTKTDHGTWGYYEVGLKENHTNQRFLLVRNVWTKINYHLLKQQELEKHDTIIITIEVVLRR